jgi:tetratricopeptide (TPR) repeat protein
MKLLDRFRRRAGYGQVRATLLAIEDLLTPDRGSPRDEPRDRDPRYLAAGRTLRAALEELAERQRSDPMLGGILWNALGNTLARQWPEGAVEALCAHEKALAADPENASYWYDLGLSHKYAGRFAEGIKANQRSLDIRPGDEGALWNLGICATGAGDHHVAMEAWTKLHIDVELVDGEVRYTGRGIVQVRITERGPIVAPGDGDPDARLINTSA